MLLKLVKLVPTCNICYKNMVLTAFLFPSFIISLFIFFTSIRFIVLHVSVDSVIGSTTCCGGVILGHLMYHQSAYPQLIIQTLDLVKLPDG